MTLRCGKESPDHEEEDEELEDAICKRDYPKEDAQDKENGPLLSVEMYERRVPL